MLFALCIHEGAQGHDLEAFFARISHQLRDQCQPRASAAKAVGHFGMIGDHPFWGGDRIGVNGGVKSDHWAAQNQASGETLSAMARVLTT